jgi:hypothetical protein
MTKLRKISSIEKLPADVLEALQEKYPEGWNGQTTKINKGNNEYFHAISLDFEDISYLIKVPVEIDSFHFWEKEDDLQGIDENIDKKRIEKELAEDMEEEEAEYAD